MTKDSIDLPSPCVGGIHLVVGNVSFASSGDMFSNGVFYEAEGALYFSSADLFNTRYTKNTHRQNSISCTFYRQTEHATGGISCMSFKLLLPPPVLPDKRGHTAKTVSFL